MNFKFFLFLIVFVFSTQNVVLAQSQETTDDPAAQLAKQQAEALTDQVINLTNTFAVDEATHFFVIYNSYNIYSLVGAVRDDVKNAVDACSKNNRDMADNFAQKFQDWDTDVSKGLKESRAGIDNMILAQSYLAETKFDSLFDLVDKVRAYDSSRFEKVPVTTPEACEFMITKMDETKETMTGLLKGSLLKYPEILRKNQE